MAELPDDLPTYELLNVPGMGETSAEFRCELIQVARRLGTDPNYLATIMSLESGLDPSIRNVWCMQNKDCAPSCCATGLIQFMPSTARALGTTTDELALMSDYEQLVYVEKFYRPYAERLTSVGDVYMATFLPALVGEPPETVLGRQGDPAVLPGTSLSYAKIYEQNAGFDRDKDGVITIGDVTSSAENRYRDALNKPPISFQCWPEEVSTNPDLPGSRSPPGRLSSGPSGAAVITVLGALSILGTLLLRRVS